MLFLTLKTRVSTVRMDSCQSLYPQPSASHLKEVSEWPQPVVTFNINTSPRWTEIATPHTWQRIQETTSLTALHCIVLSESHNSPSVLCLLVGSKEKKKTVLFTIHHKTKLSLHGCLIPSTGVTTSAELCYGICIWIEISQGRQTEYKWIHEWNKLP